MGPHVHPKHLGCRVASHHVQAGRLGVPGRGWGPWQRGRLRVLLPPTRRPCQGSPPRNYSICHKITEQGGSLPAPFLTTLPELPPPPHTHTAPQTVLAQDPWPRPQCCSQLTLGQRVKHPMLRASPASPTSATGSARMLGEMVAPPPSQDRAPHCPLAQVCI